MPSLFIKISKGDIEIKKSHYVYEITNIINNKKYIGKRTCSGTIEKDSLYFGSGILITRAINKYGLKNFKKKILSCHLSAEEAFLEEKRIIEEKNAVDSKEYYNLKPGGLGVWIPLVGENNPMKKPENKLKVSIAQRGKLNHNYGKKASEKTRRKMSESQSGENNGFYGREHSEESKQKISRANKVKLKGIPKSEEHKKKMSESSPRKKKIIVDGIVYLSLTLAEQETGISRKTLANRANNEKFKNVRFL